MLNYFLHIKNDPLLRILSLGILFTVFSGALRKWIFVGGAIGNSLMAIQLIVPLGIAWVFYKYREQNNSFVFQLTHIYFFLLLLMAVNPLNATLFHGALGLLLHTVIWILLYGYLKVKEKLKLSKLNKLIVGILILELIISGIQYSLPPSHILNSFANEDQGAAVINGASRASGTFSYLGGLQGLMIFWAFFCWYAMLKFNNKWLTLVLTACGFLCALFTGSRGSLGYFVIIVSLGAIYTGYLQQYLIKGLGGLLIVVGVGFFFPNNPLFNFVERTYENFEDRVNSNLESGETADRLEQQFGAFSYHGEYPIFGVGLGSTYQGATALFGKAREVQQYGYYEAEGERLVIEGGYLLYFFRLLVFGTFLAFLKLPKLSKLVIFVLFSNSLLTFNVFIGIFFSLGLIWLDWAYFSDSKKRNNG